MLAQVGLHTAVNTAPLGDVGLDDFYKMGVLAFVFEVAGFFFLLLNRIVYKNKIKFVTWLNG